MSRAPTSVAMEQGYLRRNQNAPATKTVTAIIVKPRGFATTTQAGTSVSTRAR